MSTLLDKARENRGVKAQRVRNLKMLNERLEEAKLTYSVIKWGGTLEEDFERKEFLKEIARLEAFIESEKESIRDVSEEASDYDVSEALKQINV